MLTALLHPSLGIVVLACLASCYFAACQIALRDFSRPRMQELLDPEGTGNLDRYQTFLDEVPRLLVMTGFVRSLLNLIVVLSVLYLTEMSYPELPKLTGYSIAFLISGTLVTLFSVGIPSAWRSISPSACSPRPSACSSWACSSSCPWLPS